MSFKSTHDVRVVLVREKYFSVRPKPLERWLWQQSISPSAERVFWVHWEEGHRNKTWCSEIPIKRVAAECCLDVSTVTRAYQQLAAKGLLRRQDPGRDPRNPFQQATAITEVRLPRELVINLARYPSRRVRDAGEAALTPQPTPSPATPNIEPSAQKPRIPVREGVRRLKALEQRMSAREAAAFSEAQRTHAGHIEFDADTKLTAEERAEAMDWLSRMAVRPPQPSQLVSVPTQQPARRRTLTVFELARARRELTQTVGIGRATELMRQIAWAVERGSLQRFDPRHGLNIALKKIRDGAWTTPNRMPPNWILPQSENAQREQCRTA